MRKGSTQTSTVRMRYGHRALMNRPDIPSCVYPSEEHVQAIADLVEAGADVKSYNSYEYTISFPRPDDPSIVRVFEVAYPHLPMIVRRMKAIAEAKRLEREG